MRPLILALILLAHSAQAALAPISVGNGSANGWTCKVVTWTDSKGLPRSAWIATTNHKITRLTYYIGASLVTDDEVAGYGMGNLTNHHSSGCAAVTRLGAGVSGYAGSAAFAGTDHFIWRSTFTYASCGSGYSWRMNNDYVFINGRDDFLQTATYDSSDVPAATAMNDDMRGPYDQMTWGGSAAVPISGVGWGNTYKFKTLGAFTAAPAGCPYSCSGNMAWDWTQPNTVPYIWAWKDPAKGADIDREVGVVQNQREDEQDFGGGFYAAGNMPASLPAASTAPHPMFECWSAPTQMDCYDSPWTSTRMTWGATYSTFNNGHANDRGVAMTKLSYRPINSWSWMHLVGKYSDGGVAALVADTENIYKSTLSATAPTTVALTGPRGAGNNVGPSVGSMPVITYPKAGYDYVYRAWTLETAGANAAFALSIPGGATLVRPIFALRSAPGLPCKVSLDGVALAQGTDYSASYDAATQKLWLTCLSTLAAGSRSFQVLFTCGSPTPTPTFCAACTATPTLTATATASPTLTLTPTPPCSPTLIDDLEDNNNQNAFGGWWSTYAGSSTISPSPFVMSAVAHASAFGARAYGNNVTAGSPSLSTSFASATDVSAYSGVSFWFNGDGGAYRFQVHSQVEGANYNDYKVDFSPPAGWSLVTLPFSSLSHPGWGPAYPLDLTQWLGISWVPMTAGAFAFTLDDITLVCPAAPSPTASPTLALGTFTSTRSATATRTPSPTASPTPTRTPTASASPSPTASASRTATASATPSPSASPTTSSTHSPTATATDAGSPSSTPTATDYAGTPTNTTTASETASPPPSATSSPTFTVTPLASPSATPTLTPTATLTLTLTPSASPGPATATPTPSVTLTPTWSATCACGGSATATPSPVAALGPPEVEAVVPWPNPGASSVQFKVKGKVERCRLEVYTPAMVLARGADLPLPALGWNQADLRPYLPGLASGLYFVRVQVQGGGYHNALIARAMLVR